METIFSLLGFGPEVVAWVAGIAVVLLTISESLPFSDSVKSNGIFQAVVNVLRKIVGAKPVGTVTEKKPE